MIRRGESLADGGTTQAEVAIVGAGAIGVALAVRLSDRVGRIVLIEAGEARFKPTDNLSFFKAERIDDTRHAPTELYRRRMLGGTTSVWGGRCIPFDLEDFAPTRDRPGWPIPFTEVNSYVPDALEFLDAGPPEFSAATALPDHPVPLDLALSDLALDHIERYSKPTNVWRKWSAYLAQSRNVTVIHGAACTRVLTNAEGTFAAAVELMTVSRRRHTIAATKIVLACGGLETPRLLLASRARRSCGLGNERDLVGRFYMTHLVSSAENVGALVFAAAGTARAFDFNKTVDGIYGRRMILLSPEARRRESLPNIVFRPTRPPMDDASHRDSVLSAMFLVRSLLIPPEYARSLTARLGRLSTSQVWREHCRNVASDVPGLMRFSRKWLTRRTFATRKLPSVFLYRKDGRYPLEFNAEQMPNSESRVMLGNDTDSLGMPRIVVQWKFRDTELDAICRAYHMLASLVAKSGLGEVQLDPDLPGSVQRALVPQGGHHIGTVRMGAAASDGVVDTNCEVWGTRELFVAGTAVLPTSGFANPTLTAVALAFRLAEHLVRRHNEPKPATMKSADRATDRPPGIP
jgi:choline dehydrogenase-like flavoprotein